MVRKKIRNQIHDQSQLQNQDQIQMQICQQVIGQVWDHVMGWGRPQTLLQLRSHIWGQFQSELKW